MLLLYKHPRVYSTLIKNSAIWLTQSPKKGGSMAGLIFFKKMIILVLYRKNRRSPRGEEPDPDDRGYGI